MRAPTASVGVTRQPLPQDDFPVTRQLTPGDAMSPPSEVMTPMPTQDALAQASIQAMRSMSDHIAMLSQTVTSMASDLKETRDATLRFEAQDLKSTMTAVRTEALANVQRLREDHDALIAKLRADHDGDIKDVETKADANARSISRIQGIFLPLGMFATAALAIFGEWISSLMSAGPPHHP